MLLGCGCLLAMLAGIAPRLVLIIMWFAGPRLEAATSPLGAILGIIFVPYTTIMYILVWSPGGISGWDWVWVGLGLVLDLMKWGMIGNNRRGIPGYPQESY